MNKRFFLLVAVVAASALAASLPYDETANAKAEIQQSLAAAKTHHGKVLVIFGANWCEDCRVLDRALKADKSAKLIAAEFEVVKVDVGRFDRNLDVVAAYGNPIKKGIPAAVVLSAGNRVLYATRAGELADARRMSEGGIYDFFRNVTAVSRAKP
ncbi:MAG: thioredoxin family protein [Caldimonas sp.]|nr:thioredoxin family protein [Pseudomonadota bacterium]